MAAAVEDHDLVLRGTARKLVLVALGRSLDQHFEFAPHVAQVARAAQFVLQGDDFGQPRRLHLFGHVVGQVLVRVSAGALRIFEHIGELVADLAHQ